MNGDPRQQALCDRLFARYDKKASAFNTLLSGLVIFAVTFFGFVLVPYVMLPKLLASQKLETETARQTAVAKRAALAAVLADLQRLRDAEITTTSRIVELTDGLARIDAKASRLAAQRSDAAAGLDKARTEHAALETTLRALEKTLAGLEALDIDPREQFIELRSFLVGTREAFESGRISPDDDCVGTDPMRLATCRVQRKVREQLDAMFTRIERTVVTPIATVDAGASTAFASRLALLRANAEKTLLLNPDFWHTVEGKELFYTDLLKEEFEPFIYSVGKALTEKRKILDEHLAEQRKTLAESEQRLARLREQASGFDTERDNLAAQREELDAERGVVSKHLDTAQAKQTGLEVELAGLARDESLLKEQQKALQANLNALSARTNSVQSPFGTLPIGLDEAVLAYPLIIAAGFIWCCLMLADVSRIRCEIHAVLRGWDSHGSELADRAVVLMAPLWIEPGGTTPRLLARMAVLIALGALFVGGVLAIVHGWATGVSSPMGGEATQIAYGALYVVSLVAAIVLAVRVQRFLGRYDPSAIVAAGTPAEI